MKRFLLSFLTVMTLGSLFAQKAPDFQLKDINGNDHHLYSYMNEGKAVLIDFSTTWCGPCWGVHQTHFLEDMYQIFGPNGTNQMQVLFIESDATTTQEDLEGTGSNTQGNWLDGVTHPVIDLNSDEVKITNEDNYNVKGFPTIKMVSPVDTTLSDDLYSNSISIDAASKILYGMVSPKEGKDLSISSLKSPAFGCGAVSGSFIAANGSTTSFENPEFEIFINGTSKKVVKYNGTISPNSYASVAFEGIELDATDENDIQIKIKEADDSDKNNTISSKINKISTENRISFSVKTDKYSEEDESSISILNASGTEVYNSGVLPKSKEFKTEVILEDLGCHTIVLKDGYGDGFGGTLTIIDGSNFELFNGVNGSKKLELGFNVGSISSVKEVAGLTGFNVTPNPASDFIQVNINLENSLKGAFVITNQIGQVVYSSDVKTINTQHVESFDVSDYSNGVYFIQLKSENQTSTMKFVKTK